MTSDEVYVLDIPSPCISCFEMESVELYRWNRDSRIRDIIQRKLGSPLLIFDVENLDTVVAHVFLRNKLGRVITASLPFEISLYDPSGKLLWVECAMANFI